MPRLVVGCNVVELSLSLCSSGPEIFPMLGKLGNSSAMLVGGVTARLGLTVGRKSFRVLSVVVLSLKSSLLILSWVNLTGCFPELTELSGTARLGTAGKDLTSSNLGGNPSTDVGLFSLVSPTLGSVRSSNLNLKLSLEKAGSSSAPVFVFRMASNNAIILSDKCST